MKASLNFNLFFVYGFRDLDGCGWSLGLLVGSWHGLDRATLEWKPGSGRCRRLQAVKWKFKTEYGGYDRCQTKNSKVERKDITSEKREIFDDRPLIIASSSRILSGSQRARRKRRIHIERSRAEEIPALPYPVLHPYQEWHCAYMYVCALCTMHLTAADAECFRSS